MLSLRLFKTLKMEAKEYLYENYSTKPDIDHPYKLYWNEDVIHAMNEYAKLKCEQLLCLAAEKARIIEDGDIDNPYEEYSLDLGE
jgi:hypothetical protein